LSPAATGTIIAAMIKTALTFVTLLACLSSFRAGADVRSLKFFHTHTGKTLEIEYFSDGEYSTEAMQALNLFLADFRNHQTTEMDPALLDILYRIKQQTGSHGTFEVISAYRSPETNDMLRSRSNGVAKNSQHLHGRAIDVRLTDVDTKTLQQTALALKAGGVGYYRKSDFVHIDTGRVRRW
jgi:uncharacterized protein YcbK (DUF882 family)